MLRSPENPSRLLHWLIVFLLLPGASFELLAEITITGTLRKNRTSPPIPYANFAVRETGQQGSTDGDGRFQVTVPEPGFYTFRFASGETVENMRNQIRFDQEEIEFYLAPEETVQGEGGIEVIGFRDQTRLSRFRFTQDEIKRLPGVYGDSLKAVNTLPGISPSPPIGALPTTNILTNSFISGLGVDTPYTNSVSSGFLVLRGSGPRASQFFLDGFKIQYPFHLGDQSSVVNNDYIRVVDVYTGTFPVRYGNATGGIISILGPDEVETPGGHINVSLFLSDAYYEHPLWNDRSFIVATARQSYPNYALLATYPDGIPPNAKYANYQDGQFKAQLSISRYHEFEFVYFGARDFLNYTQSVDELDGSESGGLGGSGGGNAAGGNSNTDGRPPIGLDRGFLTGGARYTARYENLFQNKMQYQVSRFAEDFEIDFRSPFTGETIFGFEVLDVRQEIQYADELTINLIDEHVIANVGAETNIVRWELSLRNFSPQESTNPDTPSFVDTVNDLVENNRSFRSLFDGDRTEYELNAYFGELEIDLWRLRLTPGARVEEFTLSGSRGFGPRGGAELSFNDITGTTLLAGGGRHFNVPPGLNFISIEAGNPSLKMEEAEHMAAGFEQEIGEDWLIKVEVFRNIFTNLVVEDRYVVEPFSLRTNRRDLVTMTNEILYDPFENRALNFSNDGTGWSEGYEIFIKKSRKPGRSGFFGWLSYTNSLTKRNNHQPRLTDDQQDALTTRNLNRDVLAYIEADKNFFLYYDTGELEFFYDNDREELYDLDRTHQINLVLNYRFNATWQLGMRWRYATNVPFTPIESADQTGGFLGQPTFIPNYSDAGNSERLPPFHQMDLRLDHFTNYEWGYANWYVELINVYGRANPETQNFDPLRPYLRGTNPETQYESTFIETPTGNGRRYRLPLINFGMEIQF